ncbi:helix-turn-helix transcriptional regulator [Mucilaginibacter daejeonensis]|uniref:helix-turn-helix domain-containing protein n=1 Tax=Mucilaginibacter daejeonensis TaxID=398049 RepID=UPI001D17837D|nr:helix-turn-helix transcriptional regulator [Mucilaginibacter daejeonensis]UEG51413.1 helix-turn-helix transcriptional regulator [Mucilaginibacter daejeonensis]
MAETIHIGRKISRLRELRGLKQDALAAELGISQQAISKIEQSESLEDETLERIAKALGTTPDAVKHFNEDSIFNNMNNTFHDNSILNNSNYQCTFNPLDKVVELYERLLKSEQEKVELMKKKE